MRTVKMQGGLGNQLFCLGFAHTVARLTGAPVALDLAAYDADRYGHDFDLTPLSERLGMPRTRKPLLSSRLATAALRPIGGLPYVSEGAPPADGAALRLLVQRGRYFNGYWQDEAYLSDAFRDLARAFLLERGGQGPALPLVIHCRTYQEEARPDRRAIPGRDWFVRCLDQLEARGVNTDEIVLISDNPMLALERIGDIGRAIRPVTGGTVWADMAVMLRAQSLILTNSSFSWWGGWCGAAERVCYPAPQGLFHYARPAASFEVV